ncbi:MAG: hypothetical protein QM204_06525 [Bacillota bacterium]|mgnify:CR=1 FL=1|jgi:O-antigen/teichoic acid export membrane protein|nr:hypothetical protein [Bacillota bacterium]NLL27036.1 hypothetical protein [Erysipelotrichia bacterium]
MSRTKKFVINVFFSASLSIITMIAGFIVPKIMLLNYGSEINGLVSSITQFINYFVIVEAGLTAAAVFALYKPLAEKNQHKINEVVSTTKVFYYKTGLLFLLLVIILAIIYPFIVETSIMSSFEISLLVLTIGFIGVSDFFTLAKYRTLLSADQKTYVVSIASIVGVILNTIIIVVFSNLKFNILIVRLIALFSVVVRTAMLIIYVKKNYVGIKFNLKPKNELLNKRWDAFYLRLLDAIQNGSPYVILTVFSSLINVSIYTIYNMVMLGVNNILTIFINNLAASFGEIIAKKEKDTLKKAYNEFEFSYYNLITIIYSLTFILILPFIKIYTRSVHDANYILPDVAALFVLNGFLFNVYTPQKMLINAAGLYKETKVQTIIQALIIIVLGIILTPKYGLIGILITSIISNLYRVIDLVYFIPTYVTKTKIKTTVYRIFKMFFLGSLIILSCYKMSYKIESFFSWIIIAIICGLVSLTIIVVFDLLFERNMVKSIMGRLRYVFLKR